MKNNWIYIGILFLVTTACSNNKESEIDTSFVQSFYELAESEFDKEKAYETVAFVEQYWRLAGNEGFNESVFYVEKVLEQAGFVNENQASDSDRLVYRMEKRPMEKPTWEPVSGTLSLKNGLELLNFETNRNMIPINSYATEGEKEYEVVPIQVEDGQLMFKEDVKGKVVYAEYRIRALYDEAVAKRGAAGVIAYYMPAYLQPEKNTTSIQFSRIPLEPDRKAWGILLSFDAKQKLDEALQKGENQIKINLETKIYDSEELTLIAELKGSTYPEERLVFSAHVQEPGANDNASGVGTLAESASTLARLLKSEKIDPERSMTFLFGDEIISTHRYIVEDETRAKSIKWGISMDMTGEDTEKTGGSFLIEKMPDPSAIWTRGKEKHSEWGGEPMAKEDMKPHYLNDFILNRFLELGEKKEWEVNTNPYEGGSDHTPFIRNDIPGLLLWHFTDQFYHTDNDRLDKVSPQTMKNVGVGAIVSALILTGNQDKAFGLIRHETEKAALDRLKTEYELSKSELNNGGTLEAEIDILETWTEWYLESIRQTKDLLHHPDENSLRRIEETITRVLQEMEDLIEQLKDN